MKYVDMALCIGGILLVAFILLRDRLERCEFGRWRDRSRDPTRRTVCITCGGAGWIQQRERTLEFTGDGFADVEVPATMCTACGGSGSRMR
jgi:hypothetical protein